MTTAVVQTPVVATSATKAEAATPTVATSATKVEAATPTVVTAAEIAAGTGLEPHVGLLDPAAREHPPPRLRLLRYEPDPARPVPPQPATVPARRPHVVPVDHTDQADLRRHVERVLRLALEVLDGRRPLAQLTPHLTPRTVRYMRAALAGRPPLREPSRMTSLRLGRPCTGVVEVAVVYRRGPRARALAARFERARPGSAQAQVPGTAGTCAGNRQEWRCVTLRLL